MKVVPCHQWCQRSQSLNSMVDLWGEGDASLLLSWRRGGRRGMWYSERWDEQPTHLGGALNWRENVRRAACGPRKFPGVPHVNTPG